MSEHRVPREKKTLLQRLVRRVVYKNYGRNLLFQLQLRALNEAADYAQAHMANAMIFEKYGSYVKWLVGQAPKDGLLLEFGVAGGHSIRHIAAAAQPRLVHGFDSFEGLPEDWAGHLEQKGAFTQKRRLPSVPSSVALHVGWFNDTLPGFMTDHPGHVALLHIDCDLYSGAKYILDTLADRIRPGTIILFDEYFNYPSWREHEFKAWAEFVAARKIKYSYAAFTAVDGCVAVRVDAVG